MRQIEFTKTTYVRDGDDIKETVQGYFHEWGEDDNCGFRVAVIEDEQGYVHEIQHQLVRFKESPNNANSKWTLRMLKRNS